MPKKTHLEDSLAEKAERRPRYYLAHPIKDRRSVRSWELGVERTYAINLFNPFYDGNESGEIKRLDKNVRLVSYNRALDGKKIVEGDIKMIKASDGVVAIVTDRISVGTAMEIFFNSYILKKPTHIIIEKGELSTHPWLRYLSEISNGDIYHSREEFVDKFVSGSCRKLAVGKE